MADEHLPTDEIVKKRVAKTFWLCPDGHMHERRKAAESCLAGRPMRLKRKIERLARERERQLLVEAEMKEAARRGEEAVALKERWQASELYNSELEPMVSLALVAAGVVDRRTFVEIFINEDNTLDLEKFRTTTAISVDDYSAVMAWLNSG